MRREYGRSKKHIGTLIRHHRVLRGISQAALAYELGYRSPQFISDIERGRRLVPQAKIPQIAKILSIDTYQLQQQIERDRISKVMDNRMKT